MANSTIDRCRHATGRRGGVARQEHPAPDGGDEAALARRFRDGDPDAVREVYARYSRPLRTVALRQLFDAQHAKDVVQQTFLQAWRAAGRFDPERPLAPWLFQICRRVCIDVLRKRREPVAAIDDHEHEPLLAVPGRRSTGPGPPSRSARRSTSCRRRPATSCA